MPRSAEAPPSRARLYHAPFVTLMELVASIEDGSRLGVGGALLTRLPLAALHALAARRPRDLVYVSWGGGLPLEILLGAGAVAKIVFCFSSLDIFGLAPLFRQAAEENQVAIDEWPAFAFTARLEAAKQNLPMMPFRLPGGSDLLAGNNAVTQDRANSDSTTGYARRLDLDVFLLHAQRADEMGNVEIFGSRGMDTTAAFAARRVLVTVEEVVPREVLGTLRNSFVIPRHFVHALSVVPAGAYPASCLPYYTADFAQLALVTAQSPPQPAMPGPAVAQRLRDTAALTGEAVTAAVAQLAAEQHAGPEPADGDRTDTPETTAEQESGPAPRRARRRAAPAVSVDELMVCWLASQLDNDSICSAGAVSPLAATSYLLAKATHAPDLTIFMTSGGLLDVAVRPMLLSLGEALDTASAAAQCGGEDSYRWYYQQGRVSCEVVTAAQIDRRARTNNIEVTSPSGRRVRLPGQGGMADVADLHQNFILYLTRHSALALVDSVERVSAARSLFDPAARLRAGLRPGVVRLITNLGVFAYSDMRGELVLQSLHPGVSLAELRESTGFEPAVAEDLTITARPSPVMLRVLREQIDPLGIRRLEFAPAKERSELLAACIAAEQDLIDRALHLSLRRQGAPEARELRTW
ncbi:MAG TPA: CoA-transferase [Streptosporangiaceae bacterium]|nr:CoA-transferase [Streptosporangiaceae bacterium]